MWRAYRRGPKTGKLDKCARESAGIASQCRHGGLKEDGKKGSWGNEEAAWEVRSTTDIRELIAGTRCNEGAA